MPRPLRASLGGVVYHVLNRAVAGARIFDAPSDYAAFEGVLAEARNRTGTRIVAYCVMPNHWHLVLWPREDGELSRFVAWLTLTHVRRWHQQHRTTGSGHLYQNRFRSFPVETDEYYERVCRYVERNPLRASLVQSAESWRWSSLWRCEFGDPEDRRLLGPFPVEHPPRWASLVNQPLTQEELDALRDCVARGRPYGTKSWQERIAKQLGLESTMRPRGRPRKKKGSGPFSGHG